MKYLRTGLHVLALAMVLAGCAMALVGLSGAGATGDAVRMWSAFLQFVVLAAGGGLVALGAQRLVRVTQQAAGLQTRRKQPSPATPKAPGAQGFAAKQAERQTAAAPVKTDAGGGKSGSSSRRSRGGRRRRPSRPGSDQQQQTPRPAGSPTPPSGAAASAPETPRSPGPVRLSDVVYPDRDRRDNKPDTS